MEVDVCFDMNPSHEEGIKGSTKYGTYATCMKVTLMQC